MPIFHGVPPTICSKKIIDSSTVEISFIKISKESEKYVVIKTKSYITFEEAKYMLVSCSAFLNYLIQVYEKNN